MTGILTFPSRHGPISIEVDEEVARAARGDASSDDLIRKGPIPASRDKDGDVVAKVSKQFDEAMSTLKAYTANLQDVINGLDMTPREVSVEIGLTLKGEAGFIIAKAGTEAEMKIALTWEPKPKAPAAS